MPATPPLPPDATPCPCGRLQGAGPRAKPLGYAQCCGRYVGSAEAPGAAEAVAAPDAESLMRSRYTAFAQERADYLLATWHPSTRPASLELDAGAKWLGLQVRSHCSTGPDRAEVEFIARYRVGGRAVRMHETSRFVREGGRWFYVDGNIRP